MTKRLLALFLTLVMLITLLPASAFAEGETEETGVIPTEEAAMEAEGETWGEPAGESAGSIPELAGEELPLGAIYESPAEESYSTDGSLDDMSDDLNAVPEAPVTDELQAVTTTGKMLATVNSVGSGSVSVSANRGKAMPGDTITASVSINSNPGVMFISITPSYDSSRLELTNLSAAGAGWTVASSAYWDGANDESFTGNVVTMTFKVKDGAEPGSANISVGVEAYNYEEETVVFSVTGCSVKIVSDLYTCGDNLTWNLENGVLTISGSGDMTNWEWNSFAPWYDLRETIAEIVLPEGLTSIGSYAFYDCEYITGVEIPLSVTSIGERVFLNCDCLTSVEIPEGMTNIGEYAFSGCSSLRSVTIPSSVTSIRSDAFSRCDNIESVYIDDLAWWLGLSDSIGDDLPHGDLYLNGEVVTEITVPEGSLGLRPSMFANMSSLQNVTLPEGLRIISDSAFQNCCSLTATKIPSSVISIGYCAFENCKNLSRIVIPSNVSNIRLFAFSGCSKLKTIAFLGYAPAFDDAVFASIRATALYPIDNETWTADKRQSYGADSLAWIGYRDVPAAYTIHYDANGGSSAPADQLKGHGVDVTLTSSRPTRVGWQFLGWSQDAQATEAEFAPGAVYSIDADLTLYAVWQELNPGETVVAGGSCGANLIWVYYESGLLYISGHGAMTNWNSSSNVPWYSYRETIAEIILPEGLTSIGSYAFSGCKYVTSVKIPSGVTSIGNNAFHYCSNLTSVKIPSSVTNIGNYAFSWCNSLTSVMIPSSVTSIGSAAFDTNNSYSNGKKVFIDDLDWWLGLTDEYGYDLPHGDLYLNGNLVTEIDLTNGSYVIRPYMFSGMKSLRNAVLPTEINNIPNGTFYNCTGINSITIPANVISIGNAAFFECSNLQAIYFLGDAPAFDNYAAGAVCAISFYPIDNVSWTSDKLKNYGGQLTWTPYRDEPAEAPIASMVSFDANNGKNAPKPQYKGRGCGLTLTETVPTREYYRFQGWAYDQTAIEADLLPGDVYTEDGDVTLYAVWTPKEWPVEFQPNGGDNAPESMLKTYGTPILLPTEEPTREGFVFLGWGTKVWDHTPTYFPGDQFDESGNPDDEEAIQLYAVWQLKSYVVVYKANGGEDAPEPQIKYYGRTLTLSEEIPTREGYVFLGWSTNRKATEPEYLPGGSYTNNKSASLYAIWEPEKDRPMFRVGEGSASVGRQVDIPIRLEHNPGIYALTVSFSYDTSALKLIAVTPNRDAFPGSWQTDSLKGATWMSNAGDIAADETILTLSFLVKEETEEGDYAVNVSLGEIVNEALDDIRFGTGSGKVTVTSHLPGDVNGDGSVTTKDFVVLMKYLAGEEVEVDESALDINGDGNVTTKDFVILMRYVAGEDVVIY